MLGSVFFGLSPKRSPSFFRLIRGQMSQNLNPVGKMQSSKCGAGPGTIGTKVPGFETYHIAYARHHRLLGALEP